MENVKNFYAGDLIIYLSRPHLVLKVFTNNAGVKYDALIVPISSKNIIGDKNLIEFNHSKLKFNPSYLKIINLTTIKLINLKNAYRIDSLDKSQLIEILEKIKNIL